MPHLSHSGIESYAQCPRRYALERVERVPRAPTGALVLGTAFHAALEAFGRSIMAQAPLDVLALDLAFLNAFEAELRVSDPRGCLTSDAASLLIARGQAALSAFLADLAPVFRPVAVEETFEGEIDGLPGWHFTGRIDARTLAVQLDGTTKRTIIDFKCLGKPWSTGAEHGKPQVEAYYWGSQLAGQEPPEQMTFVTVITSSPSGWQLGDEIEARLDIRTTHRTDAHVAAYQDMVIHRAEQITVSEFPAAPGPLCGWCGVLGSCVQGQAWLRERGRAPQPEIARFMEVSR